MKQFRITSANFVLPGESGDGDAYIDPADLALVKTEAGLDVTLDLLGRANLVPPQSLIEQKYAVQPKKGLV